MNSPVKSMILLGLVVLLSACAYDPYGYGSYSGDGSYYPQPSNYPYSYPGNYPYNYPGNYQGYQSGYWNQGRPYNDNNNNYQYNRPQPKSYRRPDDGEVSPAARPYPKPDHLYNHRELPPAARPYPQRPGQ